MRPLKLSIEGFTCFRCAQALEFSKLDLFAIAGPTGAGKSSILDAITFALYGKVPRLGKKSWADFISHGADRMSVMFDFELGGKGFRATRVGYRNKPTQAQLDEIKQGKEQPLASGVQQVNAEIEGLLGLRYEAFTQAVILPQGEFAHFLRSAPAEQGEILRDLLRLQIYERMREAASQRNLELSTDCENVSRRLAEDYADASSETLAKETEHSATLRTQERNLAKELKVTQADFGELKLRHGQTKDLERKREVLSELKKREREISSGEAKLEAAKRAAPVVPVIEAALVAEAKAAADTTRLNKAREQEDESRDSHRIAQKQLEKARHEVKQAPEVKARIAQVDEIRGLVIPANDAQKRADALEKRLAKLKQDIASAQASFKKSTADVSANGSGLKTAKEDLDKLQYDPELDRRIEAVREDATEVRTTRKQLRERQAEFNSAEDLAAKAATKAQRAETVVHEVDEKRRSATGTVSNLGAELKRAEREEAALIIRGSLREGEQCPVCAQTVSRLPPRKKASASEALRAELDRAQATLEKAEKDLASQRDIALTARNAASSASTQSAKLRQAVLDLTQSVIEIERKIAKIAAGLEKIGGEPEERILETARQCAKKRDEHDKLKEQTASLQKSFDRAEHAQNAAAEKVKSLSEQLKGRAKELSEAKTEAAGLRNRIFKVVGARDLDQERARLATMLNAIERALATAEKIENDAASKLARADQTRIEIEKSTREAQESARKAREQAARAAREVKFRDELAAQAAVLSRENIRQLETDITGYKQDRHSCEKGIDDLESQLGGNYVSDKALQSANEKVEEKRKEHQGVVQELGSVEREIKQLKSKFQTAAKLKKELKAKSKEQLIYKQLSDDLKRDAFQAFLLEDTFAELVKGASIRLKELSDRYTFDYSQKSFFVLDHDNAGARRSADTLSGGETFLASLALALELSEQVQRAAGAVSLDSLFIDEGFGSLDAETLNTVAGAIESLHVGGRTIGIITHIDELTERLPARIRVRKSVEGSELSVEVN